MSFNLFINRFKNIAQLRCYVSYCILQHGDMHACMSLCCAPIQGPIPDTKTPTLSKLEIGLGQDSQPKEELKVLQQDWMTERVFVQCMGCHFVSKFPEMMYGDKTFMLISCTFLFLHSAKCIDLCCYSGAIM